MVDSITGGRLGPVGVALAFAFVVTAVVFATGHLSGAHINPAVTLAFWSVRKFPVSEAVAYVIAQCGGAVLASLALRGMLGPGGNMGATLPQIAPGPAFAMEWLLSFVLMLVIMAAATDGRAVGPAPLVVGLTVGFCALVGGPVTGASMNPARSFGPALVGDLWRAHWIYWLAPITGMLAGARAYEFLRSSRRDQTADALPPAV